MENGKITFPHLHSQLNSTTWTRHCHLNFNRVAYAIEI